jgi:hypothetical protein
MTNTLLGYTLPSSYQELNTNVRAPFAPIKTNLAWAKTEGAKFLANDPTYQSIKDKVVPIYSEFAKGLEACTNKLSTFAEPYCNSFKQGVDTHAPFVKEIYHRVVRGASEGSQMSASTLDELDPNMLGPRFIGTTLGLTGAGYMGLKGCNSLRRGHWLKGSVQLLGATASAGISLIALDSLLKLKGTLPAQDAP